MILCEGELQQHCAANEDKHRGLQELNMGGAASSLLAPSGVRARMFRRAITAARMVIAADSDDGGTPPPPAVIQAVPESLEASGRPPGTWGSPHPHTAGGDLSGLVVL